MNETKQWLSDYGLGPKEIETYLVIAQNPGCRVTDIQRHTGIVRTSIYYALNQLKSEDLIYENIQNNIRTFRINDRSVFRTKIMQNISAEQDRLNGLDQLESYLSSITNDSVIDSHISRHEGIRAIKLAIESAMRADNRQWHVLAARDNFLSNMPKTYQKYYLSERERRGITAKTLWEPSDDQAGLSLKNITFRSPRQLPASFVGAFNSLVIIYDDKVLIIDPYNMKTAHTINSSPTANLLRLTFMAIWDNAPAS